MNKRKKVLIIVASVILSLVLALTGVFFLLIHLGKSQFHRDDTHISTNSVQIEDESTINYNGKKYILNKNIVSVLVMGIDRDNVNQSLGSGNNGQADVVFVATIDTQTNKTCIIPLSRETMVDVNLYTKDGQYAGSTRQQLCLAYAYGNSPEECSTNVMTSVRRLLCNININSYITIEMDGVEKLTDLVGGVELTLLEDIKFSNNTVKQGERITLNGEKAITYIQYRDEDTEANSRRMARQKQFLSELVNKTGNTVIKDFSMLGKYYNTISPYFSTNISFAQIAYLAQNCLSVDFGNTIDYKTIDGTLTLGDKWVEFEPNKESILQTVIDVFYLPKE